MSAIQDQRRAFLKGRRIMSVRERERGEREIRGLEAQLQGQLIVPQNAAHRKKEGAGMAGTRRFGRYQQFIDNNITEDQNLIRQKIARKRAMLSRGAPDSLSKAKRLQLEKRIVQAKEWLRGRMCPRSIYQVGYKDPNFEKAKAACGNEMTDAFNKVASQFQNDMRQLDPDNPNAGSLENIRPD